MSDRFLLLACGLITVTTAIGQADDVDFSRDIRPVLSGRCFKCHGPNADSREADLRLDQRQEAIDIGAIVPAAPDESSLVERTTTDDPALTMPPDGDPLSPQQMEALRS